VDVEHPLPLIETLDRANDHAVGILAVLTWLANNVGHGRQGSLANLESSVEVLVG
jgi:hypothetical protein